MSVTLVCLLTSSALLCGIQARDQVLQIYLRPRQATAGNSLPSQAVPFVALLHKFDNYPLEALSRRSMRSHRSLDSAGENDLSRCNHISRKGIQTKHNCSAYRILHSSIYRHFHTHKLRMNKKSSKVNVMLQTGGPNKRPKVECTIIMIVTQPKIK